MTTSAEYKAKSEALKIELEKAKEAEAEARRKERAAARAAQEAAYNKELEEAISFYCHEADKFKEKYPRTYEEALRHAEDARDGASVEGIAEELDSILSIVRLAIEEA